MRLKNKKTGIEAEISFRQFRAGDEEGFRECICDFYGDGYPYKEYFEPGFLAEKCQSGKLFLSCAVTEDGEIAGTSGARFDGEFAGSGLMCLRVVKKAYRGMGIATIQRDILLDYLKEQREIRSLYVDALCHDTFSQEDIQPFGFVTCGIRIELYDACVMLPKSGYQAGDRISQTIMCKAGEGQDAGEIYCPAEHREIAAELYHRLGCGYRFCDGKAPVKNTVWEVCREMEHQSCIGIVRETGEDFEAVVGAFFEKEKATGCETFLCYVNLSAAGAEMACETLKKLGFFFAGMKPLNGDGEYLLMTWLRRDKIASDLIKCCADGKELLAYIERSRIM